MINDHKAVARQVRDMIPFIAILEEFAKFFKTGQKINILEIGVRRGLSTNAFLRGIDSRLYKDRSHLYSIDIVDRSRFGRSGDPKEQWTFMHSDSRNVDWDKDIDILFIDGDHTYAGVKADYEKYEPYVVKGGLIILHDITNRRVGVPCFWKEIKALKVNLNLNNVGLGIINKRHD